VLVLSMAAGAVKAEAAAAHAARMESLRKQDKVSSSETLHPRALSWILCAIEARAKGGCHPETSSIVALAKWHENNTRHTVNWCPFLQPTLVKASSPKHGELVNNSSRMKWNQNKLPLSG